MGLRSFIGTRLEKQPPENRRRMLEEGDWVASSEVSHHESNLDGKRSKGTSALLLLQRGVC
ncbi:hypothetical protein SCHPADRAFT_898885 [Schizopora paradoxa]|uniref:Uncharacterized protein n=1 Tax=Schizopora paradoxa TaxID=27342 RepID=A0A0H2SQD9_9AGAM|nr:hypothetical protein SCHPADRAFT_898885 [Schizopora paradoxa]